MRWAAEEQGYPVAEACRALHISRAGYYQWRSGKAGVRTMENRRLAGLVKQIHNESPDKGSWNDLPQLKSELMRLMAEMKTRQEQTGRVDKFMALVDRYTSFEELTTLILN